MDGGAFFRRSLGKVSCPLEREGQVERGLPRTGDCPSCTRSAHSALSHTQTACDTLADASITTASMGYVALKVVAAIDGAFFDAWSTSMGFVHRSRVLPPRVGDIMRHPQVGALGQ